MSYEIPGRDQIIQEMLQDLSDPELSDKKAFFIIKALCKYDKELGVQKALEMRSEGRNRIAINAFLLSLHTETDRDSRMEEIDFDEY